METNPHFLFDKELTPKELNFWSTFFDHFPCHHHRNIQFIINSFSKQLSRNSLNLVEVYLRLNDSQTNQEMFYIFSKQYEIKEYIFESYIKTVTDLNKIIPDRKPIELFLMSIYSGFIQDWNLELSSKGISLINTNSNELSRKTYVPQLAMVADLMAGRIQDIFPKLDISPINISGEIKLDAKQQDYESYIFSHKKSKYLNYLSSSNFSPIIERTSILNKIKKFDFSYDFSKNTEDIKGLYSPLQYEQNTLLNLIRINYIKSTIQNNDIITKNKFKI